jgi:hypothetical protein
VVGTSVGIGEGAGVGNRLGGDVVMFVGTRVGYALGAFVGCAVVLLVTMASTGARVVTLESHTAKSVK